MSRGSLIVTGDRQGVDITISQPGPGQITITGNTYTKVNGADESMTFSGVTHDLRIRFGSGDDTLTFDQTTPIMLLGDVAIEGGRGSNSIWTAFSEAPAALHVGGNLTVLNLPGSRESTLLANLHVSGDVRIVNQGGETFVNLEAFATDELPAPVSTIGGDLWIINEAGKAARSSSPADVKNGNSLSSVNVGGDVRIRNAGSAGNSFSSIHVGGDMQIRNLGSANYTLLDSTIGENAIGGDLQVSNSLGRTSETEISGTTVGHNLSLSAGGYAQNRMILQSANIKGKTDIRGGRGVDSVFFNDVNFGETFHLQTDHGADEVTIGGAALVIVSRFATEYRTATRMILVDGSQVPIEFVYVILVTNQVSNSLAGGPVVFAERMTIDLGNGTDSLNLAFDRKVTFNKAATIDGGKGLNRAHLDPSHLPIQPKLLNFRSL